MKQNNIYIALACMLLGAGLCVGSCVNQPPDPLEGAEAPSVDMEGLRVQQTVVLQHPTDAEVLAMAQAMSGECYEHEYGDMLNVGMAICNRADYKGNKYSFPDTVQGVCAQPGQIFGYDPTRTPKDIYVQAAKEVLNNWYGIKNGENRPWEYGIMFWTGISGTVNTFRNDY